MDQIRIGKFIANARKKQNLTQEKLAEKLGITKNAVSKWERGICLMDMSLLKPLSEILGVSVNEILSGELITDKNIKEKVEENIVNTINYSSKKMSKYNEIISIMIIIFGLFISLSAIMIFPSESSWSSIYSVLGIIVFMIGILKILSSVKWYKKLFLLVIIFVLALGVLLFTDYFNVVLNEEAPRFRTKTTYVGKVIYYDTPFYDVYRCNFNEDNEYWVIKKNAKKTIVDLINFCD